MKKKKDITHPGDFASNTKLNPPLGEGGAKRRERVRLRVKSGFSLIELMISLIAISLITAAFAPVISKKLSSSEFTIGVGSGNTDTLVFDTLENCKERFGDYCTQCWVGGKCAFCSLNCSNQENTYLDVLECSCASCSNVDENCLTCSDSKTCTKCSDGYYIKDSLCEKTPAGTYSPDGIAPQQCPEGKYCLESSMPSNCPDGKWSNKGAKSASECTNCEQGYSCKEGIKSPCGAGKYSKTGASTCTSCEAFTPINSAYYSTGDKNSSCTICDAGSICLNGSKSSCENPTYALQGSTYCSECENCTQCDNKTGNCTQCKEGFYILNSKCTPCTTGYYCPGGSDSARHECPNSCVSCTSQTNCTSCKANFQYDNGECKTCPDGYYCSGGTATAQGCPQGCTSCTSSTNCANCSNGYYLSDNKCIVCEKGNYCTNNTKTPCQAGTYTKDTKQTSCQNCPKGYYCTGGSNLAQCAAGTYRNATNGTDSSSCSNCTQGYYSQKGASVCSACSAGSYSQEGSNSCAVCTPNCRTCATTSTCAACSSGYTKLTTGLCVENSCLNSLSYYYFPQGAYYTSGYNVGDTDDSGQYKGPFASESCLNQAGISVCKASSSCEYGGRVPTCWQGTTATPSPNPNEDLSCTTYGGYSGCTRTVCNWFAANVACTSVSNWRLPTSADLALWGEYIDKNSNYQGSNGLKLCDYIHSDSSKVARCYSYGYTVALGTTETAAMPPNIHTSTFKGGNVYMPFLGWGTIQLEYRYPLKNAASVRCISP